MSDKAIMYDMSLCTACRGCQVSCKQWNDKPAVQTTNRGSYENPKELSSNTWLKMRFIELERDNRLDWRFLRRSCMHCTDAGCMEVCPVGAIFRTEEGFVNIDNEWCIGCGNCTQACPFHVPHLDHDGGVASKCSACSASGHNRLSQGLTPACVKSCPTGALSYDDRDSLLEKGRKQVQKLKDSGHANAMLYGENELSGLHVLYVLDDKPEVYGLPENPQMPTKDMIGKWLAGLATAGVLSTLPLMWVFKRREENMSKGKIEEGV